MRINHNIAALNTYNQLSKNSELTNKALGKLSSGLRINQAGDDPAGLSISEKMRAQIRGLNQATRNAQDGISLVQTAEGALNETSSILQRMRELAVQAGNDTATATDRATIQSEMDQLASEITRIADTTKFNGKELMSTATAFSGVLQIGSDSGQTLAISMSSMDALSLAVAESGTEVGVTSIASGTAAELTTANVDASGYTTNVQELDIDFNVTRAYSAGSGAVEASLTTNGVLFEAVAAGVVGNAYSVTINQGAATAAEKATGTLTISGAVTDTETITIGTDVFEFDSTAASGVTGGNVAVDLLADLGAANAAATLVSVINGGAYDYTATDNLDGTITIEFDTAGAAGNATATTDTATNASWGDVTLTGGADLIDATTAGTIDADGNVVITLGTTAGVADTVTAQDVADLTFTGAGVALINVTADTPATVVAVTGQTSLINGADAEAEVAAQAQVSINGGGAVTVTAAAGATGAFTLNSTDFSGIFAAGEDVVITPAVAYTTDVDAVINITAVSDGVVSGGLSVDSNVSASAALTAIDSAIDTVSTQRSSLGSYQNRLEYTIKNLGTAAENMTAAESRIRDVDMASEMMEFTKMNILSQAAQSMLAQANAQPQNVLQLLR